MHTEAVYVLELILLVTDISLLSRIEHQVADGSYQGVDTHGQVGQQEVGPGSGGVALGLQGGVVDDQAADKAQEEGQQETNQLVVIHEECPPFSKDYLYCNILFIFVKCFLAE